MEIMTTQEEHIIYTDGHGIKITDRNFYTEKQTYLLEGITDVKLEKRPAGKLPGIVMLLLGLAGLVAGLFEYMADWRFEMNEAIYVIDSNTVFVIGGVIFIILGIIMMVATKDHYVVAIRTAEGLRKPVVSKSREYAAHLVHLLRTTYHDHFIPRTQERVRPVVH